MTSPDGSIAVSNQDVSAETTERIGEMLLVVDDRYRAQYDEALVVQVMKWW